MLASESLVLAAAMGRRRGADLDMDTPAVDPISSCITPLHTLSTSRTTPSNSMVTVTGNAPVNTSTCEYESKQNCTRCIHEHHI